MMSDAMQVIVDSLHIYPIKSCAGMRVTHLPFTNEGFIADDREWVVVNTDSEVTWQGSHPKLTLVKPIILPDVLRLTAVGHQPVDIAQHPAKPVCQIKIWNDTTKMHDMLDGVDGGDKAAIFLKAVTGANLRLVRLGAAAVSRDTVNRCHIVSTSSMNELNSALKKRGSPAVDIHRFRPNVVVSSLDEMLEPFLEEAITELSWTDEGREGKLSMAQLCIRCVMPNVDPVTADVSEDTLQTVTALSAARHQGKPVYFGTYANIIQTSVLREGTVLKAALNF
jgi:uncharacterized protein